MLRKFLMIKIVDGVKVEDDSLGIHDWGSIDLEEN